MDITLYLDGVERYDEGESRFIKLEPKSFTLTHSLVSISLWESIWRTPFLSPNPVQGERLASYVQCMCEDDIPPLYLNHIMEYRIKEVVEYIDSDLSATTIMERGKTGRGHTRTSVTSELIYFWMISHSIPEEASRWHLSRLLKLIRIFTVKGNPEKMSKQQIFEENARLNEERKRKMGL